MVTWTPNELINIDNALRTKIADGTEFRCPYCFKIIELTEDDEFTELVCSRDEIFHAECLKDDFNLSEFWDYISGKHFEKDLCEWFYAVVIDEWNPRLEDALISGMKNCSADDLWDFVADDIEDFVEWLIDEKKI
jgi:hypothetical protein